VICRKTKSKNKEQNLQNLLFFAIKQKENEETREYSFAKHN